MKIGIVGSEAAKFTPKTEAKAKALIRRLLANADVVVSGHCHLGGIDLWAEEIANEAGLETLIFPPAQLRWEGGYKQRNLQIAHHSDSVYCIAVRALPPNYTGMRFPYCYHCHTSEHVKSGGCWTVKEAIKHGRAGKVYTVG